MGTRDRFTHPEVLTLQDDGITAEDIRALSEGAVEFGRGVAEAGRAGFRAAYRATAEGVDLLLTKGRRAVAAGLDAATTREGRLVLDVAEDTIDELPLPLQYKIPLKAIPKAISYFAEGRQEGLEERLTREVQELLPPAGGPLPPDMQQRFEGFVRRNEQILTSIVQSQPDMGKIGETLQQVRETLRRNQDEGEYRRNLGHASNIVKTTTQLLEISGSSVARTFSTAANGCIQLYDAQRGIRSEMAKVQSSGFNIGSALSLMSNVGTVLSVGSAIFSLFDGDDGPDMQVIVDAIREQVGLVRQDIREFREEVAGAFNALSAQVGTFQQEMNRRLDELNYIIQHNGTRLERCIGEVYHVNYVSNRDEIMRLISEIEFADDEDKPHNLARLLSWAVRNCTLQSLTGFEMGISSADIVLGLKDKSIEAKLGLLKKLAGVLLPAQEIMARYAVPNPMFWRHAAFAYMDTLASLPEETRTRYMRRERFINDFKQIIKVGTDLQEFVRQTQRNRELFNAIFRDYKDGINAFYDEMVRSNNPQSPEAQGQLERIGRAYELMRAFSELAFNGSYNEDRIFNLLMKRSHQADQLTMLDSTGKVRLLRLPNAEDLTALLTQNANPDFRKTILIQVKQMIGMYKAIVDLKISSVLDRGAVEPYIMVEDTLNALRQFGREYIGVRFREQECVVQEPRIEGITGGFMTQAIGYEAIERVEAPAFTLNPSMNFFNAAISTSREAGSVRIVNGPYSINILEQPAIKDASGVGPGVVGGGTCRSAGAMLDGFTLSGLLISYPWSQWRVEHYNPSWVVSRPSTFQLTIAKDGNTVTQLPIKLEAEGLGTSRRIFFAPTFFNIRNNEMVVCLHSSTYYFANRYQHECKVDGGYSGCFGHNAFYQSPQKYKIQIANLDRGIVVFDYNMPEGQIPQRAYLDPQGDLHYEYKDARTNEVKHGIIGFDRTVRVDQRALRAGPEEAALVPRAIGGRMELRM